MTTIDGFYGIRHLRRAAVLLGEDGVPAEPDRAEALLAVSAAFVYAGRWPAEVRRQASRLREEACRGGTPAGTAAIDDPAAVGRLRGAVGSLLAEAERLQAAGPAGG